MFGKKQFKRVMIIPDLHLPYEHRDAFSFLKAVEKKYCPDKVVCLGDELDYHAISFHDKDPDLPGAGQELANAKKKLRDYYKLFPEMDILESNHGSLVFRRALNAGLPRLVFRGPKEILEAPEEWNWHFSITLNTPLGEVNFKHGSSTSINKLSQSLGMNAVQGHYHSKFYISYWSSPKGLFYDMNCGCLIDKDNYSMAYGKNLVSRPVLGCGVILNGRPRLIPMVLTARNRWDGKI